MITCITLNSDGTEAFREIKPKRFVPKNGFERGIDGCFYKHLGSPLIISDIEKAEEIKQKQRLQAAEKQAQEQIKNLENRPQGFDVSIGSHVIHMTHKINYRQIRLTTSWTYCTRSSSRTTFENCKFNYNVLGLPKFDCDRLYKKIEIDFVNNLIKVWFQKPIEGDPDYYVIKPFNPNENDTGHPIAP